MLFWILYIIAFLPLVVLLPIKLVNKKNLKQLKGKNYIIACNHMSNFDPVAIDFKFHKQFKILAKKELFKDKFKGGFYKTLGAIPVDRENPDAGAVKEVLKQIKKRRSILIFPQGTRVSTPSIAENAAKEGVAMFAIRTNTPVLPVMIDKKIKFFRRVKIYVGEPMFPDETRRKDKDYVAYFSQKIVENMNKLLEGETKHENERL